MKVFKSEIEAGLQDLLGNRTVAYTCDILLDKPAVDIPTGVDIPEKAVASWDLFNFYSILASVGWNKNDDVFDKAETWAARNTPVLKKVNYQHDETDIIGVITASIVLDRQGNVIHAVEPPDEFDIAVSAALYKVWSDDILQARMTGIIEEIQRNEWFVSMECLFRHFDYAAITPTGQHKIIPRTEETSFLTKHLRTYGGTGEYNGYRLGRLLRDFTFSGKGLVKNPANKRSIILNFQAQAELSMPEPMEDYKNLLTKAEAKIEKLQEELQAKVEAAAKAEQEKLAKTIEKQNLTIAELQEEMNKLKTSVSELENQKSEFEKENKSLKEELTKAKVELDKANEALAKVESEKKSVERLSLLASVGVSEDKAKEILALWANASDDQFKQIVELAKVSVSKKEPEPNPGLSNPDLSKAELEDDNIPNADPTPQVDTAIASTENYLRELFKSSKRV